MDSILQRDARKLMEDSERIKLGLGRLERDCSLWARESEKSDIEGLMEDLKQIEIDVSMMTRDCVSAYQHGGNNAPKLVFHDLHQTFVYLDALFNDLKKTRSALHYGYIHPDLLEHLDINCERFTKTAEHIRRDIDGLEWRSAARRERVALHRGEDRTGNSAGYSNI